MIDDLLQFGITYKQLSKYTTSSMAERQEHPRKVQSVGRTLHFPPAVKMNGGLMVFCIISDHARSYKDVASDLNMIYVIKVHVNLLVEVNSRRIITFTQKSFEALCHQCYNFHQ